MITQLTLCIPCEDNSVLLGFKKRGFGAGQWNGFGGKVEDSETIEAAAHRELYEESGLTSHDLAKQGVLTFSFESMKKVLEVHVYMTKKFTGTPRESEEMKPQWFDIQEIPFQNMWPDDEFWFPYFLAGKRFNGTFHFDSPATVERQAKILCQSLKEVRASSR